MQVEKADDCEIALSLNPIIEDLRAISGETERRKLDKGKRIRVVAELKKFLKKMQEIKMSLDEYITRKPFPKQPLESELAKEFIGAVKISDIKKVRKMLLLDKYLVYQFDYVRRE